MLAPVLFLALQAPSVLVLPVQNTTGEKWAAFKEKQTERSAKHLSEIFAKRGFRVIDGTLALKFAEDAKVDFSDEENYRKAVLFDLAKRAETDYVVLAVITATDQNMKERLFYKDIEGSADVKMWLLDARKEEAIVSAKTFTGRSGGNRGGIGITKGSDRQIQAAINAINAGTKDFLKGFSDR